MKKENRVIIKFTKRQRKALSGLMVMIDVMAEDGKPGLCIAQVWPEEMDVGVLKNKSAQKLIGIKPARLRK